MLQISNRTRLISSAFASVLLAVALSPAHASDRSVSDVLSALPAHAAEHLASVEPTLHRPWLAPIGHRQPRRADLSQSGSLSVWEQEQQRRDQLLDRKLIICRGC